MLFMFSGGLLCKAIVEDSTLTIAQYSLTFWVLLMFTSLTLCSVWVFLCELVHLVWKNSLCVKILTLCQVVYIVRLCKIRNWLDIGRKAWIGWVWQSLNNLASCFQMCRKKHSLLSSWSTYLTGGPFCCDKVLVCMSLFVVESMHMTAFLLAPFFSSERKKFLLMNRTLSRTNLFLWKVTSRDGVR